MQVGELIGRLVKFDLDTEVAVDFLPATGGIDYFSVSDVFEVEDDVGKLVLLSW